MSPLFPQKYSTYKFRKSFKMRKIYAVLIKTFIVHDLNAVFENSKA